MNEPSIFERMHQIQQQLKAPKSQYNEFGRFNYRNCEDIIEAAKPLFAYDEYLRFSEEMIAIGDRYYVKSTAFFHKQDKSIQASSFAREASMKKGMDDSQITGACSSYARKYALSGLFSIEEGKDADASQTDKQTAPVKHVKPPVKYGFDFDDNAKQWIQCIKAGTEQLSSITDNDYRQFIESKLYPTTLAQ